MSSARKRASMQKANGEIYSLRHKLMLAEIDACVAKIAAKEFARQRDELAATLILLYDHCCLYHPDVEKNNVGEQVRTTIEKVGVDFRRAT